MKILFLLIFVKFLNAESNPPAEGTKIRQCFEGGFIKLL